MTWRERSKELQYGGYDDRPSEYPYVEGKMKWVSEVRWFF